MDNSLFLQAKHYLDFLKNTIGGTTKPYKSKYKDY